MAICGSTSAQVYQPLPNIPPPPVKETQKPQTKQGLYFGFGTGGISVEDKMTTTGDVTVSGESSTASSSATLNAGDVGFNSDLFIGYSWKTPNRFFMGIEGFGNWMNASASTSTSNTSTIGGVTNTVTNDPSINFQYVYGARALPGYQMTEDTVIYGIVGYAIAQAKTDLTVSVTNDASTTSQSPTEESYSFNGYQLGLGSMLAMSSHTALRADIIYTGYGTETLRTGTQTTSTGTVTGTVDSQPTTLEADVSLVFKFD